VIYNLFAYTDGKIISHVGIMPYKIVDDSSDEDKLGFLKERCLVDHVDAHKARIVSPEITLNAFNSKHRMGTAIEVFEELFQYVSASSTPLFVMTIIENGEARIDHSYTGLLDPNDIEGEGKMIDYLVHYTSDRGINFIQMFDDDYFKAIKLLFNNGFLVSSTKLLMVFVDTAAFVEYGDEPGNFKKWLNAFARLDEIDLEAGELWELRNGVLHMSNLHSRGVISGKVARLVPSTNLGATVILEGRREKQFDLLRLIEVIAAGVGRWMESYNADPQKIEKFVERYDTVISDSRVAHRPP
jgi:hypothetical protein